MPDYDIIIAGAGCAGLSLVYRLLHSPLSHSRILIIDQNPKNSNDRTWCFWNDTPTLFEPIVSHQWKTIEVKDYSERLVLPLQKLTYKMIRGIDFYDTVRQKTKEFTGIQWLTQRIVGIEQTENWATVRTTEGSYTARWVFDSLFDPKAFSPDDQGYHYLIQHFQGYTIRTEKPAFDPQTVTMFDFRTPQPDGVYFFYILPFSETEGMVEFTVFSKHLLPREQYHQQLENYIHQQLSIKQFEITEREWGVIPMTDFRFERQRSPNVMRIGTNGGKSRASTGYTFLRIQEDSEQIVNSLVAHQTPFYRDISHWQFEKMDSLLLNLMHRRGGDVNQIFMELFSRNPVERILRFLEDRTTTLENLQIMASVTPYPFLEAIRKVFFGNFEKE